MLALQRHDSGSEREREDALWGGARLEEGANPSGSIEELHHLMRKSIIKGVSPAKDPRTSPSKPDEVQPETSRNEQQKVSLQKSMRHYSCLLQKSTSWPVTPTGSLQNGWQETSHQSALASPDPFEADSTGEPAETYPDVRRFQDQSEILETQVEHMSNPKQTQVHDEGLHGSVGRSLGTRSRISLWRRRPKPFPNPQESLGEMIQTRNENIKGKAWIAKGPALELFKKQIGPRIEKILHNTEPPHASCLITVMYMVGKRESSASPIVMLCCSDRKVRKEAEALVRESDILQQFPQVGLGNSAKPFEPIIPPKLQTGRPSTSQMATKNPTSLEIHGFEEPVIGRRLRFVKFTEGREIIRFATGGPFIQIENRIYQLTAYHIGRGDTGTDLDVQFDSDPDECEYDGQYDTDEDDGDFEEETTRESSIKPTQDTALEAKAAPLAKEANWDLSSDLWSPQDVTDVDRALLSRRNIDYFLVKLPAEEASKASNTIQKVGNHGALQVRGIATFAEPGTPVIIVTSYCYLTGSILPGTLRVKMNGFYGFQDLFAARLSVSIKPGDSGSAVFDASTGCFYGHVIMGSAPDTIVYIVPSFHIFTEISTSFGESPTLNIESSVLNKEKPPRPLQQEQDRADIYGSVPHLLDHIESDTRPIQIAEIGPPFLSPSFGIHSLHELGPGNVFYVIMSEPRAPSDTSSSRDLVSSGNPSGIRLFIVARPGDGLSSCIPIRIYGESGWIKDMARPHQDGIIYNQSSQPELLPGEPELGFPPVRFESSSYRISKEFRAAYSCLLTVDHNVKIAFIGRIMYDDWWIVRHAVDSCWSSKRKSTKRQSEGEQEGALETASRSNHGKDRIA